MALFGQNHRQREPGTYGMIKRRSIEHVRKIAERERAPMYVVGETTTAIIVSPSNRLTIVRPFDLAVEQMFGSSPKTYSRQNR